MYISRKKNTVVFHSIDIVRRCWIRPDDCNLNREECNDTFLGCYECDSDLCNDRDPRAPDPISTTRSSTTTPRSIPSTPSTTTTTTTNSPSVTTTTASSTVPIFKVFLHACMHDSIVCILQFCMHLFLHACICMLHFVHTFGKIIFDEMSLPIFDIKSILYSKYSTTLGTIFFYFL